jgi:periplasmic protein TonB
MTITPTNQTFGTFRLCLLASLFMHGSLTVVALFLLPKISSNQPDSSEIIMVNLATPAPDKSHYTTTSTAPSKLTNRVVSTAAAVLKTATPATTVSATPQVKRTEIVQDSSLTTTASTNRGTTSAVTQQSTRITDKSQDVSSATQTASIGKAVPREMTFGSAGGPAFRKQAQPVYPSLARRRSKEGVVVLRLSINENGNLTHIELIEDPGHGFAEAAIEAVRSSSFSPAHYNGKPVAIQATLPIRFTLR